MADFYERYILPRQKSQNPIFYIEPSIREPKKAAPEKILPPQLLPQSNLDNPTLPADIINRGSGSRGGGSRSPPSISPNPISSNLTPTTPSQDRNRQIGNGNPLSNVFRTGQQIAGLPNDMFRAYVIGLGQSRASQGDVEYFNKKKFNELKPYEQRGTAQYTKVTPLSDEQLIDLPLNSGMKEYTRRVNKRVDTQINIIVDNEASKLEGEFQSYQNQFDAELQYKIDSGQISIAEAKVQQKQFNLEMENLFKNKLDAAVTPKVNELTAQANQSLIEASRKNMIQDAALEALPSFTTGSLFGMAAGLSKTAGLAASAIGIYSLGEQAPALTKAAAQRDTRTLASAGISTASFLVGGIAGSKATSGLRNQPQETNFMGLVYGDKGYFRSKTGKNIQDLRTLKVENELTNTIAYEGKAIDYKGQEGSYLMSNVFGVNKELGSNVKASGKTEYGTITKPLTETTGYQGKGVSDVYASAKYEKQGSFFEMGETSFNKLLLGTKGYREYKSNPQKSQSLTLVKSEGDNIFSVLGSDKPKLRIYKGGRVTLGSYYKDFRVKGRVKQVNDGDSFGFNSGGQVLGFSNSKQIASLTPINQMLSTAPKQQPTQRTPPSFIGMIAGTQTQSRVTTKQTQRVNNLTSQSLQPKQKQEESLVNAIAPIQTQQEKNKSRSSIRVRGTTTTKENERLIPVFYTPQSTNNIQRSRQTQKQTQTSMLKSSFGFSPYTPKTTLKTTITPIRNKNENVNSEYGFLSFVKIGKGFKQVTKRPVTKSQALLIGSSITDRTLSRSFKIVPTRQKVNSNNFNVNLGKFRQFKQTKGRRTFTPLTFIERSRYSLEPGEQRQIKLFSRFTRR